MTYEEMASDAGYRGEEAAQVSAALEARERAQAEREWAAEQEAQEEERMSENQKLSERMADYERVAAIAPVTAWMREVAALEAKLEVMEQWAYSEYHHA